jgi:peptide deformylase
MSNRKTVKDILILGDPRLYEISEEIKIEELPKVKSWVSSLNEAMSDIRKTYNFGRGIAAPQLGIMKRLIYTNVDAPKIYINPTIIERSDEEFEMWDDCMSFPNLLVKVSRSKSIKIQYYDEKFEPKIEEYFDDMSELIQHEIDHLNGILATMRAIDNKSFKIKKCSNEN